MVKNTVIRLKRETSKSLYSTQNNGLVGYLLKVTVENYLNIDPNIFVMQRDVGGTYGNQTVDTFYSIASVGELETLSVNDPNQLYSNFYRCQEIELMFETPQDLESAWQSISSEVRSLVEANDLSINTEPDVVTSYPVDAFLRYFGSSALTTPTEASIKNLNADAFYSTENAIKQSIQLTQQEYYFFATTDLLAEPIFWVNGNTVSIQYFDLNITNKYGLTIPYKVFRTSNPINVGSHLIEIKRQTS